MPLGLHREHIFLPGSNERHVSPHTPRSYLAILHLLLSQQATLLHSRGAYGVTQHFPRPCRFRMDLRGGYVSRL